MTVSGLLVLLPFLLGLASSQDDAPSPDEPQTTVRRLTVERQWLVRVPVRTRPVLQRVEWVEAKGYNCVRTNAIRGALLTGPNHVDLLLPQRQRIRAKFDGNCPALDFYGGFYLKTDDQRVCARRDSVHSRMGGSCRIEGFRRLLPRVKD